MKRKIFSVFFALVLVLSFSMVTAVPAAAASYPQFLDVVPVDVTTGEWSKTVEETTPQAGTHSYHVVLPTDASGVGLDIIHKYIYGPTGVGTMTLADITGMTFWEYVKFPGGTNNLGAGITLYLDTNDDGEFIWADDVQIVLESPYNSPLVLDNIDTWMLRDIDNFAGFQKGGTGLLGEPFTGVDGVTEENSPWAEWKTSGYADYDVVWIGIVAGWGDYGDYDGYFDDFVINGETYDLQPPIFLDDSFYQVDDTVTVTVMDSVANTNPAIQESVVVTAASTLTGHEILLGLLETGVDTGVFTETFTLVGTTPGTGELLVTQGSEVTVTYAALDPDVTDTAKVDSAAPVVEITAPEDVDFVAGAVDITFSILEDNLDTSSLTIDGLVVEDPTSSYSWDTTAEAGDPLEPVWPDGPYTIELLAQDLAGSFAFESIAVTVDNTDPSITDAAATPPTIYPATETEVTFSASIIDDGSGIALVEISGIPGVGTLAMLDEDADDIYTVAANITASEANYTLTITATDSVDVGAANEGIATITLVVATDIIPPVISSPAITYPFGIDSAQPGEAVTIFATVTDEPAGLIDFVKATCAELTGSPIDLLDNGEGDDVEAGDDIYTATATVAAVGWGDYPITINTADESGNTDIDETLTLAVRIGATGVPINLFKGWNLISLPLIPDDSAIAVVISADTLASANVSYVGIVRGYNPATGDFPYYMPESGIGDLDVMEDGVGYWVFMNEDDTLTITGRQMPAPPEVPPTYDVVVGWNLIGFKSLVNALDTYYLANIEGTYPVLWSYDATVGAYSNVKGETVADDCMVVGHGFWIWITEAGTIVPPE